MKTIVTKAQITSVRSKVDRSLSLNIVTPELTPVEKTLFMELQGADLSIIIRPEDNLLRKDSHEVKGEFDTKTPSQRLRGALYVWYEQSGKQGTFEDFYREKMEKIIARVKENLE